MKKPILLSVLLIGIVVILLQSCGGGDGTTDPSTDPPVVEPLTIEVTEITRTTPSFRFHFLAFNLKSIDGGDAGRFKIVAKEKKDGEAAPTTQDMIDGAGVFRKVGGTNKPVILGFPISSEIKQFYDDTVAGGKRIISVHHATNDIDQYLLKANTEYTLYAVKAADTGATIAADAMVYTLTTLKTDSVPTAHGLNEGEFGDKDLFDAMGSATTPYYYDVEDTAIIMPEFAFLDSNIQSIRIDSDSTTIVVSGANIAFQVIDQTDKVREFSAFLFPSSSTDGNGSQKVQIGTESVSFPMFLLGSVSSLDQTEINKTVTFGSTTKTFLGSVFLSLDK